MSDEDLRTLLREAESDPTARARLWCAELRAGARERRPLEVAARFGHSIARLALEGDVRPIPGFLTDWSEIFALLRAGGKPDGLVEIALNFALEVGARWLGGGSRPRQILFRARDQLRYVLSVGVGMPGPARSWYVGQAQLEREIRAVFRNYLESDGEGPAAFTTPDSLPIELPDGKAIRACYCAAAAAYDRAELRGLVLRSFESPARIELKDLVECEEALVRRNGLARARQSSCDANSRESIRSVLYFFECESGDRWFRESLGAVVLGLPLPDAPSR